MSAAASSAGAFGQDATPLGRIDPRVKIGLVFVWSLCLLWVDAWWGLLGCAVAVGALMVAARVDCVSALGSIAPTVALFAFVAGLSSLRFDGSAAWSLFGDVGLAPEALADGVRAAARIALMVGLALVLSATTSSGSLTDALLSLLAPLRKLGAPVDDIATMLSVALRFIPVCTAQLDRVVLAQRARGRDVRRGGPLARLRAWASVMVPLFVGMFRRSEALGRAMESRCYRGAGRTRLTELKMRPLDVAVLIVGIPAGVAVAMLL